MPANLTPEYLDAENKYRQAKTIDEKLYWLERMYATIPKHKGTEKLQANIKKKISQLKKELESGEGGKKGGRNIQIEKEGAFQTIILGPQNTGKSTFLTMYTTNDSEISDYPFTTTQLIPGMAHWENIHIQFIDTPALNYKFTPFFVYNQIRIADNILLILSYDRNIKSDFENFKELLNAKNIIPTLNTAIKYEENGIVYMPTYVILNKRDLTNKPFQLFENENSFISISAILEENKNKIMKKLYDLSGKIRVYTKAPGEKPNFKEPFIVKKGTTVIELAQKIHKDFFEKFNYARVWGEGYYDGQRIGKKEELKEGLIIEFYLK